MDIQDLIVDDRKRGIFKVHRSCMTSLDLFRRERQRIFDHCWIYLGHESEVEKPGDYRRRTVAGRPLFFVRSSDGQIRVFLNSCPHRGAQICRSDAGNAEILRCFYHAWTFNTRGELIGVPGQDAYGPGFDRSELGLKPPPRVDSYRGFYFVSFDAHGEDLVSYLAGARDYLDLVVDQAEDGMRVVSGSNKYAIKANWKLLAENSLDGYHLVPTHRTYVDYLTGLGTDDSGGTLAARPPGRGRALGNGHCVSENISRNGRPIARWHPIFGEEARERIADVRARLVRKFGEERAYRMADLSRNLLVYPNLLIMDFVAISIRYIEPLAPDNMAVTAWHLVPREESGAALAARLDSYLTFLGPGGFATPDDVEALESCQAGFRATETEWSDISRGMLKPCPGTADELQVRGFWRQWHANMQGLDTANVQDGEPAESQAAAASSEADGRGRRRTGER